MEHGRRKMKLCLLSIVVVAVIIGICYYYGGNVSGENNAEGTLVKQEESYGC